MTPTLRASTRQTVVAANVGAGGPLAVSRQAVDEPGFLGV
jgi:hypothetical protein